MTKPLHRPILTSFSAAASSSLRPFSADLRWLRRRAQRSWRHGRRWSPTLTLPKPLSSSCNQMLPRGPQSHPSLPLISSFLTPRSCPTMRWAWS